MQPRVLLGRGWAGLLVTETPAGGWDSNGNQTPTQSPARLAAR